MEPSPAAALIAPMPADWTAAADTLPEAVQDAARAHLQAAVEADVLPDGLDPAAVARAFAASDFIAESVITRDPELLHDLAGGDLDTAYPDDGHRTRLQARLAELPDDAEEDALHAILRRFRRREAVRIAWRAIQGDAPLDETLRETSMLAEVLIDEALQWLHQRLCARWGTPRDADGNAQSLVVVGMGKLGGRELNFSSDIDLIFAFPESGETDGQRPRSNDEFFIRLGRDLIRALEQATVDGFVFRVDMRLRPNGDSGPLALPFSAAETYYESQGREWERYALVKARPVAGDQHAADELLGILRPFVYRRYLDYGALEQLREMKAMIAAQVEKKGVTENLKVGFGGIREVEFVAQAFQLIRGGREPALRTRRLMKTLDALEQLELLPADALRWLRADYQLLRRAENAVQMLGDEQVHALPEDPVERARVALGAGYDDLDTFERDLRHVRDRVHDQFEQVFAAPHTGDSDTAAETDTPVEDANGEDASALAPRPRADERTERFQAIWAERMADADAPAALQELGFHDGAAAHERICELRAGSAVRALSTRGRGRLDRLMPLLMAVCARARNPDRALSRTLDLIETVARRTAYLALLVEHPMALSQLVQLCDGSAWVAELISAHPLLLDELLDPRTLYEPLGREDLEAELDQRFADVDAEDLEQQMEVLRQFKQANQLKVAAADVSGAAPLMVVSDYLSALAEVVLERSVVLCRAHLERRHGTPRTADGEPAGFAVVGYGKLGGIELGYTSDLDLVFLHGGDGGATDGERSVDNQVYFARLAQRILHMLSTHTPGGILYEVDTRLRPSGNAGLMSSTLDGFITYQRESAWTWEHQALVRARSVAGDRPLREAFEAARREILAQPRDTDTLRDEVRQMRDRQVRSKGSADPGAFDLKNDRGGVTDIEFIVQFGVLDAAAEHPEILDYPDNVRLLRALAGAGWLPEDEAHRLAGAYRKYRRRLHQRALQGQDGRIAVDGPEDDLAEDRARVTEAWERIFG